MDLYIFERPTPRHPWELIKKVPLPPQKALTPVSFRATLGAEEAEVWLVEAASEQGARARLAGKTCPRANGRVSTAAALEGLR